MNKIMLLLGQIEVWRAAHSPQEVQIFFYSPQLVFTAAPPVVSLLIINGIHIANTAVTEALGEPGIGRIILEFDARTWPLRYLSAGPPIFIKIRFIPYVPRGPKRGYRR